MVPALTGRDACDPANCLNVNHLPTASGRHTPRPTRWHP